MEWLEAAVAFAVIMIVFSTMVSVATEALHRVFRLREDGLTRMMRSLYKEVLQPRLAGQLETQATKIDDFVAHMTSTRYKPWDETRARWAWLTWCINWISKIVPDTVNAKQLRSLTTLEFVERFGETPAGRGLIDEAKRRGGTFKEDFLKDLVNKYEDFGENASDYFARRARLTSVLISIVVAFWLSIDAIDIYRTLLTEKGVRDTWIAKGEGVAEQWEQQQKQLEDMLAQKPGEDKATPKEVEELIKANIKELKASTASLKESGIRIGWEYTVWQSDKWINAQCGKNNSWTDAGCLRKANLFLKWFLAVFFSGLLIGLGGSFWFDIYRKLASLTGIARGFQSIVQKPKEPGQAATSATATEGAATDTGDAVMTVFDTSAKGQAMASPQGRVLLAIDGSVDRGNTL